MSLHRLLTPACPRRVTNGALISFEGSSRETIPEGVHLNRGTLQIWSHSQAFSQPVFVEGAVTSRICNVGVKYIACMICGALAGMGGAYPELDQIEENVLLTEHNSSLLYNYNDELLLNLKADFDNDQYQLVISEI